MSSLFKLPSADSAVDLQPIRPEDVGPVGEFLHANLNTRISARQWADAIVPPWPGVQPNHGFLLRAGQRIVGVYIAFYSERQIDGQTERFCNLAAWCVLELYRSHGLRLLRALIAQKGYSFTDLSPSGSVVPLNKQFKFAGLDVATALVINLPWPLWHGRAKIVTAPEDLERLLRGRDLAIYRDHRRAAAARHVAIVQGDEICYVIFRRDRRKNLPLFASILHVSHPSLFRTAARYFFRHLLLRHGIVMTLCELRVAGFRPQPSITLAASRPKMYRSEKLRPDQIDYLYSELTCVAW